MEIIMVGIGLLVFDVVQYICIMSAIRLWSLKILSKLDKIIIDNAKVEVKI